MALNLQQVYARINQIGQGARTRQESLAGLRKQAYDLLRDRAGEAAALTERVEAACRVDPALRCALPAGGRLDEARDPGPAAQEPVTLLAADGSQIAPDRHAALQFGLLNVGAVALRPGSGEPPQIFTESRLLFDEELYTETGTLGEEVIAQRRDLAERRMLLELARDLPAPVVALTDGPVELWGAKGAGQDDYRRNLELHKSLLSQLQGCGAIVAGYVDKPGADLVVRLLEIATLSAGELEDLRRRHPLRGVSDRWLYAQRLAPGQRSAVFGLQSGSRVHYTGDLALHFFYLNVGAEKHPALVRVEIPQWVADDPARLDTLHTALLEQCRVMGAKPYPYLLHRAHETAVVRLEDKQQIEQLLALELRRAGGELEEQSGKQSAKDRPGRGQR